MRVGDILLSYIHNSIHKIYTIAVRVVDILLSYIHDSIHKIYTNAVRVGDILLSYIHDSIYIYTNAVRVGDILLSVKWWGKGGSNVVEEVKSLDQLTVIPVPETCLHLNFLLEFYCIVCVFVCTVFVFNFFCICTFH